MQNIHTLRSLEEKKTAGPRNANRKSLFIFLIFGFLFMTVSSCYALTCEETCTVTILDYGLSVENYPNNSNGSVPIGAWPDSNCATFSAAISVQPPGAVYRINAGKFYWNGTSWVTIKSYVHFAVNSQLSTWLSGTSFVKDWGSYAALRITSPMSLYPNGCSDLPSNEPDQTPNLNTGKPDCPQVPIN